MRLAYLALDRPDLQLASKELARCMQAPGVWDMQQLKRCVRYFVHRPRVVQSLRMLSAGELVVFSDSEVTSRGAREPERAPQRRSSCGATTLHHTLRTNCTTQAVISLT